MQFSYHVLVSNYRSFYFKKSEHWKMGLVKMLLDGGLPAIIRGLILLYLIAGSIIFIDQFLKIYPSELANIELAKQRYEYICDQKDAKKMLIFHADCIRDDRIMQRNAIWETVVRMSENYQMCGKDGCGFLFTLFIGFTIGVICVFFFAPRMVNTFLRLVDTYKRNIDGMHLAPLHRD